MSAKNIRIRPVENSTKYTFFSDGINQASLKSFALAGGMDRIEKYESQINPDNPALPGIAY